MRLLPRRAQVGIAIENVLGNKTLTKLMLARDFLRSPANVHRGYATGAAEGWGLYLTTYVPNLGGGQPMLRQVPLQARITPSQAEDLIRQDERLGFGGITFGRWNGDFFEEGKKFATRERDDFYFMDPEERYVVHLKCPPTKFPSLRREPG